MQQEGGAAGAAGLLAGGKGRPAGEATVFTGVGDSYVLYASKGRAEREEAT